jgi:hypothetical protein
VARAMGTNAILRNSARRRRDLPAAIDDASRAAWQRPRRQGWSASELVIYSGQVGQTHDLVFDGGYVVKRYTVIRPARAPARMTWWGPAR